MAAKGVNGLAVLGALGEGHKLLHYFYEAVMVAVGLVIDLHAVYKSSLQKYTP